MKKTFAILSFLVVCSSGLFGQKSQLDSAAAIPFIGPSYALQFPGGILDERFGTFHAIGAEFGMKLKNNIFIGAKVHYLFGGKVKEDGILDSIRTSEGGIIEVGGNLTDPIIEMTGYSAFVSAGYIWNVIGPNPNSGIFLTAGIGLIQHRMNIDYRDAQIPQLDEDYRKGYDRLTNGMALNQFVGYIHFGRKRLVNFFAGAEFTQAWTKNRRGYNFDTREYDNDTRFDAMLGFKFGWMLTLYRRAPKEFYLY